MSKRVSCSVRISCDMCKGFTSTCEGSSVAAAEAEAFKHGRFRVLRLVEREEGTESPEQIVCPECFGGVVAIWGELT